MSDPIVHDWHEGVPFDAIEVTTDGGPAQRPGGRRRFWLWLDHEIGASYSVQDVHDDVESIQQIVEHWIEAVQSNNPEWWERDSAPVAWFVSELDEYAPFCELWDHHEIPPDDFHDLYGWPRRVDNGQYINWWDVPVHYLRFPKLGFALPRLTPFVPTFPVRTWYESWAKSQTFLGSE